MAQGNERMMVIDTLLEKDNYAATEWENRGLIPSPSTTVKLMSSATKLFLNDLKVIAIDPSNDDRAKKVSELVDQLPWGELDTEEKEFLADVLAPAIQSVGLNPWAIF